MEMMPAEVKIWLMGLGAQENFFELREDLMEYLDEIQDDAFIARMENSRCSLCRELGVRVELTDVGNGEKKMICQECFDSIFNKNLRRQVWP